MLQEGLLGIRAASPPLLLSSSHPSPGIVVTLSGRGGRHLPAIAIGLGIGCQLRLKLFLKICFQHDTLEIPEDSVKISRIAFNSHWKIDSWRFSVNSEVNSTWVYAYTILTYFVVWKLPLSQAVHLRLQESSVRMVFALESWAPRKRDMYHMIFCIFYFHFLSSISILGPSRVSLVRWMPLQLSAQSNFCTCLRMYTCPMLFSLGLCFQ